MEIQTGVKNNNQEYTKLKLFISYSHKDKEYRDELDKHLTLLKREGLIETWSDLQIIAGESWYNEIISNLHVADIILLLISSDFISSDFCYCTEMKAALDRHEKGEAFIIPVLLRKVDWENSPLGKIQALPEGGLPVKIWKDQDEAFTSIAKGIRKCIEERGRGSRKPSINHKSLISDGWESKNSDHVNTVDNTPEESFKQQSGVYSINNNDSGLPSSTPKARAAYTPPTEACVTGCERALHIGSKFLPLEIVSRNNATEDFGVREIIFALFFGAFLCGINIAQRGTNPTSAHGVTPEDVRLLNLAMGSSVFFLTAEILFFLNYESEKISMFIKGVTKRLIFWYFFALCLIEVISHLDSFPWFASKFKLLIVGQVMFLFTGAIEALIDIKVAICFKRISHHYKRMADIYITAGTYAMRMFVCNVFLACFAILVQLGRFPKIDEKYILAFNFVLNGIILVNTRIQLFGLRKEVKRV